MIELSERLRKLAELVPKGSIIADIGSDHALLPSYLAMGGSIAKAIAGEVRVGPLEAARKQVQNQRLEHLIEVRLGDGLGVIQPNEVDVVIIAGMGGSLISAILEKGLDRLAGVQRLILQPNVGGDEVRRWLDRHQWLLVQEQVLEEDGYIYEIIMAERQEGRASLYQTVKLDCGLVVSPGTLYKMGPQLIQSRDAVFQQKWARELEKLIRIRKQLSQSSTSEARRKEAELTAEINTIKEVLQC